jgi:hypothetical protein
MSQNMNFGIAPRNHFTVKPNQAVTICHRHRVLLLKKR